MKHTLQLWIRRVLIWRAQHLPMQHFIFVLSILVGLISGLVAVVLKNSTHAIQAWIRSERFEDYYQIYYFAFPLVGILLTVALVRVFKLRAGEGIPSAIEAISRQGGIIPRSRMYTSFLTSAITVGFGGSVGLERMLKKYTTSSYPFWLRSKLITVHTTSGMRQVAQPMG